MNSDSNRGNDSIILGIDVLNLIVQHPFIGFCFHGRTYDDVEFTPGPNLNVVVGPNGRYSM